MPQFGVMLRPLSPQGRRRLLKPFWQDFPARSMPEVVLTNLLQPDLGQIVPCVSALDHCHS